MLFNENKHRLVNVYNTYYLKTTEILFYIIQKCVIIIVVQIQRPAFNLKSLNVNFEQFFHVFLQPLNFYSDAHVYCTTVFLLVFLCLLLKDKATREFNCLHI